MPASAEFGPGLFYKQNGRKLREICVFKVTCSLPSLMRTRLNQQNWQLEEDLFLFLCGTGNDYGTLECNFFESVFMSLGSELIYQVYGEIL